MCDLCFWLVLDLVLVFVGFGLFQICSPFSFSPHSKDHALHRHVTLETDAMSHHQHHPKSTTQRVVGWRANAKRGGEQGREEKGQEQGDDNHMVVIPVNSQWWQEGGRLQQSLPIPPLILFIPAASKMGRCELYHCPVSVLLTPQCAGLSSRVNYGLIPVTSTMGAALIPHTAPFQFLSTPPKEGGSLPVTKTTTGWRMTHTPSPVWLVYTGFMPIAAFSKGGGVQPTHCPIYLLLSPCWGDSFFFTTVFWWGVV